jgi:hypothetical protein
LLGDVCNACVASVSVAIGRRPAPSMGATALSSADRPVASPYSAAAGRRRKAALTIR